MRTTTLLPHKDLTNTIPIYNRLTKLGNYDASQVTKTMVVLHTMDGSLSGTDSWFSRPTTGASSHYGIGLNGEIHQYVREDYTTYANGIYDVNQRSITIELEDSGNPNGIQRTDAQISATAKLVRDICLGWNIPMDRQHILGHKEANPNSKKSCPGNTPIDHIVALAYQAPITPIQPTTPPPVAQSQDELNAVNYLRSSNLKTDTGQSFGNLEGAVRGLVDVYTKYLKLTAKDINGKAPIVVQNDEYIDLVIKASSFDKVCDFLNVSVDDRLKPDAGSQMVEFIRGNMASTPLPPVPNFLVPKIELSEQDKQGFFNRLLALFLPKK